jgi:hypothetical protein
MYHFRVQIAKYSTRKAFKQKNVYVPANNYHLKVINITSDVMYFIVGASVRELACA